MSSRRSGDIPTATPAYAPLPRTLVGVRDTDVQRCARRATKIDFVSKVLSFMYSMPDTAENIAERLAFLRGFGADEYVDRAPDGGPQYEAILAFGADEIIQSTPLLAAAWDSAQGL